MTRRKFHGPVANKYHNIARDQKKISWSILMQINFQKFNLRVDIDY